MPALVRLPWNPELCYLKTSKGLSVQVLVERRREVIGPGVGNFEGCLFGRGIFGTTSAAGNYFELGVLNGFDILANSSLNKLHSTKIQQIRFKMIVTHF